jgi:hypothetical protein
MLHERFVIEIQGDYLAPLADAFTRRAVAWVLEFDPEHFQPPPKGTPLVREISITYESWKKGV